jgi:uncharacterized membrane protein HdeD (DUF308 family)
MSDHAVVTSPPLFDRRAFAAAWGLVLAYGVICLGLGIVLAVWPEETLVVVAVLIAIQLLLSGVLRIVLAVTSHEADTGVRVLAGLTGGLALVVGLLCLRDPVQTILIIGLLLGVWWVVSGVVDVITAVIAPAAGRRAWDIGTGVFSILAGGFLLVNPELTLGVLVFVVCAWLIIAGVIAVVIAVKLRSAGCGSEDPSARRHRRPRSEADR